MFPEHSNGKGKLSCLAMEKVVESVISEEEIERFLDLGLGRGVDSTNPAPWINKSSFQVRNATIHNLIGTDEGGVFQSFRDIASSISEMHAELKASVLIPKTPLLLGVAAESSRSFTSSRKIIGKKVINRTISFRSDYIIDLPQSPAVKADQNEESTVETNSLATGQTRPYTFEETLSEWILKQIDVRNSTRHETSETERQPVKNRPIIELQNYLRHASKEDNARIIEDCAKFIRIFGITHYVSSITLGAVEQVVMSETQYSSFVKEGADSSTGAIGSVSEELSFTDKILNKSRNRKLIGKINKQNSVERRTYDEAVVSIRVQPLQSLVQENHLIHLALHKALLEYVEKGVNKPDGSFLIECGDEKMYWKVSSDDYVLTITEDINQASVFYIIPDEETEEPFDFSIGWQGQTLQDIQEEKGFIDKHTSIMRYLKVHTNIFGKNPGPLKMKSTINGSDSTLVLYSTFSHGFSEPPANINHWIQGKKPFFISNAHRKGFIAISCTVSGLEQSKQYLTKCVSSKKLHNEKNTWMLFRLVSTIPECSAISLSEKAKVELHKELDSLIS